MKKEETSFEVEMAKLVIDKLGIKEAKTRTEQLYVFGLFIVFLNMAFVEACQELSK